MYARFHTKYFKAFLVTEFSKRGIEKQGAAFINDHLDTKIA